MKATLIYLCLICVLQIACNNSSVENSISGTWIFTESTDCADGNENENNLPCFFENAAREIDSLYLKISKDSTFMLFKEFSELNTPFEESRYRKGYWHIVSDSIIFLNSNKKEILWAVKIVELSGDSLTYSFTEENNTSYAKFLNVESDSQSPISKKNDKSNSSDPCKNILGKWVLNSDAYIYNENEQRILDISEIEGNLIFDEYFYNPSSKSIIQQNRDGGSIDCSDGSAFMNLGLYKEEIKIIKNGDALLIGNSTYHKKD